VIIRRHVNYSNAIVSQLVLQIVGNRGYWTP